MILSHPVQRCNRTPALPLGKADWQEGIQGHSGWMGVSSSEASLFLLIVARSSNSFLELEFAMAYSLRMDVLGKCIRIQSGNVMCAYMNAE